MTKVMVARARRVLFMGVCVSALLVQVASGAPALQQATGTFDHKASVTIAGSGFGTKSSASPVVWDDASGSNINEKWSLTWPNSNSAYNIAYRNPQRGISLPHNNITRYIAGAHGDTGNAGNGAAVMVWKSRTMSSYPAYTYASWYQRSDDAWVFGGDDNYKCFDFTKGSGGYDLPNNWYLEYNPRPTSRSSGASWHLLDDAYGQTESTIDGPTSNWWYGSAANPMAGQWSKIEVEIKYTNQTDGYIKLWENGKLKIDYSGHTDRYAGSSRAEGIGGYARQYGQPNNWRYFADIYLDYSRARVVLANNANLGSATIIETQIPTRWTASAIDISVNLGRFAKGQTAYLFVVDPSGVPNGSGLPVTIGGSATTMAVPKPPTQVDAQ